MGTEELKEQREQITTVRRELNALTTEINHIRSQDLLGVKLSLNDLQNEIKHVKNPLFGIEGHKSLIKEIDNLSGDMQEVKTIIKQICAKTGLSPQAKGAIGVAFISSLGAIAIALIQTFS